LHYAPFHHHPIAQLPCRQSRVIIEGGSHLTIFANETSAEKFF